MWGTRARARSITQTDARLQTNTKTQAHTRSLTSSTRKRKVSTAPRMFPPLRSTLSPKNRQIQTQPMFTGDREHVSGGSRVCWRCTESLGMTGTALGFQRQIKAKECQKQHIQFALLGSMWGTNKSTRPTTGAAFRMSKVVEKKREKRQKTCTAEETDGWCHPFFTSHVHAKAELVRDLRFIQVNNMHSFLTWPDMPLNGDSERWCWNLYNQCGGLKINGTRTNAVTAYGRRGKRNSSIDPVATGYCLNFVKIPPRPPALWMLEDELSTPSALLKASMQRDDIGTHIDLSRVMDSSLQLYIIASFYKTRPLRKRQGENTDNA